MSKAAKQTPDAVGPAIRVVVSGEIGAGKSTILNALARGALLPGYIGADHRPVMVLRHGEVRAARIVHSDGREERRNDLQLPADLRAIDRVELSAPIPHLAGFELIELPMTTAEQVSQAQRDLVRSADILIWVTIASQAWRLTERNILQALGDALPTAALLAVSRADKLRSSADLDKIRSRRNRETDVWFEDVAFLSAAHCDVERSGRSKEAWKRTGGDALLHKIRTMAETIQPRVSDVSGPEVSKPVAVSVPVPAASHDEPPKSPEVGVLILRDDVRKGIVSDVQPARDGSLADAIVSLKSVGLEMVDAVSIGLLPADVSEDCVAIAGDDSTCRRVGEATRDAFARLSAACAKIENAGGLSACVLSMSTHRLIFQKVPDVGVVFLYAENDRLSLGAHQAGLSRLCRSCLEPSVAAAA